MSIWVQVVIWTIYGISTLMFIFTVWSKWYPALKTKLNPTMRRWLLVILNALAGFLGHVYARHYLNTLTEVDPTNFPRALLAFTVPATTYAWVLFIMLGAGLIFLGNFIYWGVLSTWNGLVFSKTLS
jgi:hypothetical protein